MSGATQAPWTQVPLGPGQKNTPQPSPFHPGRHAHLPVPKLVPCPSQDPWPLHVSAGAVPARGCGAVRCGVVRCSAVWCGVVRAVASKGRSVRNGAVRCGAVRCERSE